MDELIFLIAIAFALDLALGDPRWMPHPVRLIGRTITSLEGALTHAFGRSRKPGACLTAIIVGGAWLSAWGIIEAGEYLDHRLGWALTVYILYTTISARDMDRHASRVFRALRAGNIEEARAGLAMIVGRDTKNLSEKEIVRASVESVAEGAVDGVLAPLFFAILGGAPLAMAYRAANTLDSMVGYRSEKYLEFGWASARLDDLLNYIPARLARLLYPAAALVCGMRAGDSWRISFRDGQKSPSPNAAISEAALAGALGVQLGGVNTYRGVPEERPRIGDPHREPAPGDIPRAVLWMYASSAAGLVFFAGIRTLFGAITA